MFRKKPSAFQQLILQISTKNEPHFFFRLKTTYVDGTRDKGITEAGKSPEGWSVGGKVGVYCYAREQTEGVRSFFVAKSGRLLLCILESQ